MTPTSVAEKARNLVTYVRGLKDFAIVPPTYAEHDNMGATIADAILQPGLNYETVVRPRVDRLLQQYPEARTTTGFLKLLHTEGPRLVLRWHSDEKPNRVLAIARFFAEKSIETKKDLRVWLEEPGSIEELRELRGIGPKTADYFKMLVGIQTNAVDRHLLRFLSDAGITVASYSEAHQIVNMAADLMGIDRRSLDHSIWRYMSRRRKLC